MGGSPTLDVRLMGEPEVTVGGTPIRVDTRKAVAMLAYIAVEGGVSRDVLTRLLWPEAPPDRARATLRRTLSALRSGVGSEHLDTAGDRVALDGPIEVDVARFDGEIGATLDHGHDPADVCPGCIPQLDRATALYRGDFLEAFGIGDAPEFEDWVRTVGESLRLRVGQAFARLAMARAAVGDYSAAIAAVTRWIEIDPLHEPAHRLLMLLNAWAGDRPAAMAAYRAFVAILDRELGVPPLEETTELYEAILDEDLPPAPGVRRRTRAHASRETPIPSDILDREEELARLRNAVESAGSERTLVLLTGESWMGKTRLLEEMIEFAGTRGCTVVTGRASRTDLALPYGVMTQMVEQALSDLDGRHLDLPEWVTHELSRLIPGLTPGTQPADIDRLGDLRFLEAVQEVFRLLAETNPTLLAIDDAQWLDPASARLLSFLVQRTRFPPLTVVFAIRSGEGVDPMITEIEAGADLTVALQPLTTDHLQDRVDTQRAQTIVEATGGVPLLVMEALETGSLETPGVMLYIETRMKGVSDLSRQVLTAAAVLGGGVQDLGLLRETSGRSEEELVDAIEELIAAGLLREIPGSETVGFTLEPLEKLTYESTSLVRRRLLHRRAAQALENLPRAGDDARLAAEIAVHHHRAGNPQAALWYRRAGNLARRAYAGTEARALYEAALALGNEDSGELHLALGELAIARGDYTTAMRELRSAVSQVSGELLGRVEHRIGEVHRLLGRFDRAEESFARATRDHPRPAVLYADWALLHHRTGASEQALEMANRALDAAEERGDYREMSRAHDILAVVQPDPVIAMKHIDIALEMAGDSDEERMAALNNKARLLAAMGDSNAAIRLVEEAIRLAASTGHRHREAALRNHLADLYHRAGEEGEAREALTGAVTLFADVDAEGWEPEIWLLSHW